MTQVFVSQGWRKYAPPLTFWQNRRRSGGGAPHYYLPTQIFRPCATQRAKFYEKVQKISFGVNIISFELNVFNAQIYKICVKKLHV